MEIKFVRTQQADKQQQIAQFKSKMYSNTVRAYHVEQEPCHDYDGDYWIKNNFTALVITEGKPVNKNTCDKLIEPRIIEAIKQYAQTPTTTIIDHDYSSSLMQAFKLDDKCYIKYGKYEGEQVFDKLKHFIDYYKDYYYNDAKILLMTYSFETDKISYVRISKQELKDLTKDLIANAKAEYNKAQRKQANEQAKRNVADVKQSIANMSADERAMLIASLIN